MEKGRRIQYLVSLAVSLTAVTNGVIGTWYTPVIPKFHHNETGINITENEISWAASICSPGFMSGSLLTRFTSDKFGRKATILASVIPIIAGSVLISCSSTVWVLYLTRLVWGFGAGMSATVASVYLAEISDKEIRGTLSAGNRFLMNFGSLIVMCVGPFVSFHALSYMLLVMPICYFIACCFVPETPYYLLKEGKVDAARKAFTTLTGSVDKKLLEERLSSMRSHVRKEMLHSSSIIELFSGKQYRKALIIVIGLKLTQIMSGPFAIQNYFGQIVEESGIKLSVSTALIVVGAFRFGVGIFASVLVDKIGRRPLLLYSYFLSGISLGIVGLYFFMQPTSTYLRIIPFVGLIIYMIVLTIGYNTVVYVMVAELFPINVKSIALTFGNILGGFLNFVSVKGYQEMKNVAGYSGIFWFYGTWAIIGAIFSYIVAPETKGKSLKKIQEELQGRYYNDDEDEKLNEEVVMHTLENSELPHKVT